MVHQRILLSLFLIVVSIQTYAAAFVVTSNADAGPGTFRDALTQAAANGSATTDYITFNITDISEAGRTINVLSQLPDVSSNLVIDGSTQPGVPFGVSQAKIALLFKSNGQFHFAALNMVNQSNIQIYGLYLKLLDSFAPYANPVGIHSINTNNIQLGDVQKGNVIAGFYFPFAINDDNISESSGLIVKSNFLSIQSDGLTVTNDFWPNIANVIGNITIGGASNSEGNLLAKGLSLVVDENDKLTSLLIQNNISGINYNLTAAIVGPAVTIYANSGVISDNTTVNIEDNILCGNNVAGSICLDVGRLTGFVNIVRNYINVDKAQNKLSVSTFGIYDQLCTEVHIGSNNTSDANYVGYCEPLFAENVGNLSVTKNSFFCSNSNFIYFDNYNQSRTQCNTSLITSNSVTGTATPNAEVELYYTDICNTCSPQHYFASTTANAAGNWSYTGTISGTVIANATYIGNSSDFTFAHINTDNLSVADACGGSGSITGIKVYGAANIMWIDGNRNIVGNTEELLNIKPGKYKLIISNGGCADSTMYYTINPKFTLDTTKAAISQPACADSLGSITGLSIINTDKGQISYTWTDGKGKIWSDSLTLKNVPAGTYTFVAKGKDNCTQTFGPVEMPDQNLIIMPPSVNLVKLCTIGDGVIRVNDPLAGNSYLLYDSPTASTPIDEKKSGVFQVTVTQNKTYYISSVFYNCESERVPVLVAVGLTTSAITNSFTPNGDGINDYWVIPGIETFPAAIVQIFSRNGQKVFESRGYSNTFDGTLNGKALPAGVYYYVINLTAYCKVLSGSLTIIR